MTENDNILLEQFFHEAAQQQISDRGFSDRVMENLPARISWWSHLWTVFCLLVAVCWFVVSNGWQMVLTQVEVLLRTAPTPTELLMWVEKLSMPQPSMLLNLLVAVMLGMTFSLLALTRWVSRWA